MSRIYQNNPLSIGNTPLVRLNRVVGPKALVLAKLDREKLPGKTIEVVGVFQLINPANWMVTPVQLKVAP